MKEENVIHDGDTVVCKTSDGRMFFQLVNKDTTIRVGKKLVGLKPVIGACYGSIFEMQGKALVKVTGGLFPDPVAPETGDIEVPSTDNRSYTDTNTAQKLDAEAIEELRASGKSGKEIIDALVQNSETWDTKTEFSKQKYLKKKQQKYMPRVRFLKCTAGSLCQTYRLKNPSKICNIREDSLAQLLSYANIHAGAQVLVADTCMGLLTGAIAERMRGYGRILHGFDGQQAAVDIVRRFNFDRQVLQSIHYFPFKHVALLSQSEEELAKEGVDEVVNTSKDDVSAEEKHRLAEERAASYTEAQRKKYEAKKAKRLQNKLPKQTPATIRQWLRDGSDSLVIASHFDPSQMLLKLLPLLGVSKPFAVYCEYLEPLTKAFEMLQQMEAIIDLQLNETWTREFQVLPGRTHPEMNMSAYSGYLLSGIKIDHSLAMRPMESAGRDEEPAMKRRKTKDN